MSRKLHSIVALFDKPDDIIHAAEKTVSEGYKDFDVHTPYPVHGMDHAMHLEPTKLPYVTLCFGLFGLSFAVFFQWWVSGDANTSIGAKNLFLPYWLERYPFVIGGKPLFSLPAFVPVMFELTVLFAALSTVAALIAVFCGLPANAHPLHDTEYMKNVSSDRYGLCIEASDDLFEEGKVKDFLQSLGGHSIAAIKQPHLRPPIFFSPLIIKGVLGGVAMGVGVKAYVIYNKILYLPPFTWMETQPKLNAQDTNDFFENKSTMQDPVAGTVARGFMPYEYQGDIASAEASLVNPVPVNQETLTRGKLMYSVHCSACHGDLADGQGKVALRTQESGVWAIPGFHTDVLRKAGDGYFYHVIMDGKGKMSSYAKQIDEDDRWALIHYIRVLQRAKDAKETDLK